MSDESKLPPPPEDRWGRWYRVGRTWARPGGEVERHPNIALLSPWQAVSEWDRWVRDDPYRIYALADLVGTEPSQGDTEARAERMILRTRDALHSGWIVLHEAQTCEFPLGTERPVSPTTVPGQTARTWVEVELLDEATGWPMADELVRVVAPSGQVHERRTDARGLMRIEGLDPGVCDVSFPRIDGREWRRS